MNDFSDPTTASLECEHCHQKIDFVLSEYTIETYGIFFLVGEEDGYFGFTCPNPKCYKTICVKKPREQLIRFKEALFLDFNRGYSSEHPMFHYNSFPYYFSDKLDLKSFEIYRYDLTLDNTDPPHIEDLFEEYDHQTGEMITHDYKDWYFSYWEGDHAIGPGMVFYRFHKDDIPKLIAIENGTKLKVFPRYIIPDPLLEEIHLFCWSKELVYNFQQSPFERIDIFKNCYEKQTAIDNMALMQIFDFPNISRDISKPDSNAYHTILPSSLSSIAIQPNPLELSKSDRSKMLKNRFLNDDMRKVVWENYRKDYVQELLSKMVPDFVEKYIDLSYNQLFSYEHLLNFIEGYIKELFESIKNRLKRYSYNKQYTTKMQKRVEGAEKSYPDVKIISEDPKIMDFKIKLSKLIRRKQVKGKNLSYLFLGETGVGKDLFAQAFHYALGGTSGNFIRADCSVMDEETIHTRLFGYVKGAFSITSKDGAPGFFEDANGGSIFLDEIGKLSKKMQQRLLGVLQNKKFQRIGSSREYDVNANIIFATNRDLEKMVENDEFIDDLYYRIERPRFTVPPLRERKNDIPKLVKYFLEKSSTEKPITITDDALDRLLDYDWPGNVRQLELIIDEMTDTAIDDDRFIVYEDDIPPEILSPQKGKKSSPIKDPKGKHRSNEEILSSLKEHNGHKTNAAKALGIDRTTMHRRLKKIEENRS